MNKVGSVHGRFQPLHNGHLEYLLAAFEDATFVYIGLTQPDIRHLQETLHASHRSLKYSNPLTYFERLCLISETLKDAGVDSSRYSVVPFPIEEPDKISDYLPNSVPCYTTIYDDWNRQKIRLLESKGYTVKVLWERQDKEIQGSRIRDSIRTGSNSWEEQVPKATIEVVEKLELRERLVRLHAEDL